MHVGRLSIGAGHGRPEHVATGAPSTRANGHVERCGLSARAARKVLEVARTIADLAGEERTGPRAVAEALGYRGNAAGRMDQ